MIAVEPKKFVLRLPKDLHESVKNQAKQNRRSMNSEILTRLEQAAQTTRQS